MSCYFLHLFLLILLLFNTAKLKYCFNFPQNSLTCNPQLSWGLKLSCVVFPPQHPKYTDKIYGEFFQLATKSYSCFPGCYWKYNSVEIIQAISLRQQCATFRKIFIFLKIILSVFSIQALAYDHMVKFLVQMKPNTLDELHLAKCGYIHISYLSKS